MATQRKLRPINARRGQPASAYHLPAGQYWIRGGNGLGFRLTIGEGPHGIGVQLDPFSNTPGFTIASSDERHLELCQYANDSKAQAFKRWYLEQETEEDIALLGAEYRRESKSEV